MNMWFIFSEFSECTTISHFLICCFDRLSVHAPHASSLIQHPALVPHALMFMRPTVPVLVSFCKWDTTSFMRTIKAGARVWGGRTLANSGIRHHLFLSCASLQHTLQELTYFLFDYLFIACSNVHTTSCKCPSCTGAHGANCSCAVCGGL